VVKDNVCSVHRGALREHFDAQPGFRAHHRQRREQAAPPERPDPHRRMLSGPGRPRGRS
jgi:hypothetical protein